MRRIVFAMLPSPSHYMAAFGYAHQLRKMGETVAFTGTFELKELITDEGFDFFLFEYAIEYRIKSFFSFLGIFFKSIADRGFLRRRLREFGNYATETRRLIRDYNPSRIYLDEHLAEYYFFLQKPGVEIILLNTKFSTKMRANVPPLNSQFIPFDGFMSKAWVLILWSGHLAKLRWQELLLTIAFLGRDDLHFFKRHCKRNRIDWNGKIDFTHCFYRTISRQKTVVLGHKELDFKSESQKYFEHYIPVQIIKDENKYLTPAIVKLLNKMEAIKVDKRIIYCSFGTIPQNRSNILGQFFHKLLNVASLRKDLYFVISKSKLQLHVSDYKNVQFFDFVPQYEILKYTDIMITHGGMNSINECLELNVPMYVLPLNLKTDQPGNAARILHKGFGVTGNLRFETEDRISVKLDHLLEGSDRIKENMRMLLK
jgi:zeaxanthin glucosyltransferase